MLQRIRSVHARPVTRLLAGGLFAGALCLALAACDPAAPEEHAATESTALSLDAFARLGAWRWVGPSAAYPDYDIGMRCRDGSATGFGYRLGTERKLLIFLRGGGFCYDDTSCTTNRSHFDERGFKVFTQSIGEQGIFDPENPANPFLDWTVVYVPYCTGDVHAGTADSVTVDGVGPQQFVGYRNMERVLDLVAPRTDPNATVVLAGTSAGGIGTVLTYGLVSDRLDPTPVHLLNDSGPLLQDDSVMSPATQTLMRTLWNLDDALPPDCPDAFCSQPGGDGLEYVLPHYAQAYPNRSFAFLSYLDDSDIPGFADALRDTRRFYVTNDYTTDTLYNVGTFYAEGGEHTFLFREGRFYDTAVVTPTAEVLLTEWIGDLLSAPDSAYHADPDSVYLPGGCCGL